MSTENNLNVLPRLKRDFEGFACKLTGSLADRRKTLLAAWEDALADPLLEGRYCPFSARPDSST